MIHGKNFKSTGAYVAPSILFSILSLDKSRPNMKLIFLLLCHLLRSPAFPTAISNNMELGLIVE